MLVSRGVTTCAGMTAHTVVLAQTRVGFLTGGRKKSFLDLLQDEQTAQLEETYACATVAMTRARTLCLIVGPLNMKDLLGAATVMDTLMYGVEHVGTGRANFYPHDYKLSCSPPDKSFIDMLKLCLSGPHFSPPAIVEVLQDYVTNFHKVRRLHLIVVDLCGHGSTILSEPERSLISCGSFGIVCQFFKRSSASSFVLFFTWTAVLLESSSLTLSAPGFYQF